MYNGISRFWALWGLSSAGRATALHAVGQEFEPPSLHHFLLPLRFKNRLDTYPCVSLNCSGILIFRSIRKAELESIAATYINIRETGKQLVVVDLSELRNALPSPTEIVAKKVQGLLNHIQQKDTRSWFAANALQPTKRRLTSYCPLTTAYWK